jgi:hypothetical protein
MKRTLLAGFLVFPLMAWGHQGWSEYDSRRPSSSCGRLLAYF